jgi:hypothetical protein
VHCPTTLQLQAHCRGEILLPLADTLAHFSRRQPCAARQQDSVKLLLTHHLDTRAHVHVCVCAHAHTHTGSAHTHTGSSQCTWGNRDILLFHVVNYEAIAFPTPSLSPSLPLNYIATVLSHIIHYDALLILTCACNPPVRSDWSKCRSARSSPRVSPISLISCSSISTSFFFVLNPLSASAPAQQLSKIQPDE